MGRPEVINVQYQISSIAFTPDGSHIVSGDKQSQIRRWTVRGPPKQVGPIMRAYGDVTCVVSSKDGRWIVSGDSGGKLIIWSATSHQQIWDISFLSLSHVVFVDITSDSTRVAAACGCSVQIFNITTGTQLIHPVEHKYTLAGIKFSPSNDRIATITAHACGSAYIYNSHTGDKLFDISLDLQTYSARPLCWSPDGQQLFVGTPGKMNCVDISSSTCSDWSIQDKSTQGSIAINGRFIACSSGSSVSFWDIISHKQIGHSFHHSGPVKCISLSPDDGYLAYGNGTQIYFYRLSEILPSTYVIQRPLLMEMSLSAIELWKKNDMKATESILSDEIKNLKSNHYALAHRSLIRVRLQQWNEALEDADMSLRITPSPVGHIAKTLALIGRGEQDLALIEFDFVFYTCAPHENQFLSIIKAIIVFICGKSDEAILRMNGLISKADDETKNDCVQILAAMYLKKRDYEHAIQSFVALQHLPSSYESSHLMVISLIFGWNFCELETVTWERLCESLYASGHIKEVGETLLKMARSLGEIEYAHCSILERIVTRSGDVSLLSWTGHSSMYNSCLPASPAVYTQALYTPSTLEAEEMERRTAELRTSLPQFDVLMLHDRVAHLRPVRFVNRRLHLPCLVFRVRSLTKTEANTYRVEVTWLGEIEFATDDVLPLDEPRKLVLVHPWIHLLCGPHDGVDSEDEFEPDTDTDVNSNMRSGFSSGGADIDAEIVHASLIEEAPSAPLDTYTRALQLIARLGQPFNALLLLKQPDGTYKRVAADHVIVVPGLGNNVPKDIRAEVLEIV